MRGIMAMLLVSGVTLGYSFYGCTGDGSPITGIGSIPTGRGGAMALSGSEVMDLFLNPGATAFLENGTVQINTGVASWRETSFFYQNNQSKFSGIAGGSASLAFMAPVGNYNLGLGIARVADFSYKGLRPIYREEESGRLYIYAVDNMESHGGLWELLAGGSTLLGDWFAIGISGGLRFGSGDWELFHNVLEGSSGDYTEGDDWSVSDVCTHAGIVARDGRMLYGLSVATGGDRMPSRMSFGVSRSFEMLDDGILGLDFSAFDFENEDKREMMGSFYMDVRGILPNVQTIYSLGFRQPRHHSRIGLTLGMAQKLHFGNGWTLGMALNWYSRCISGSSVQEAEYMDKYEDNVTQFIAELQVPL